VSNLFAVMGVLKNDLNSNKEKEKKKRKGHRIIIFVYLIIQSCVLRSFFFNKLLFTDQKEEK
jgi:hypothetical protein